MGDGSRFTRRAALKVGMTALAGGLVAGRALADDPDEGKMSKSVVQYKYHPSPNGSHCAICANFLAAGSADNPGKDNRCKLVAGVIDPNGYCLAFAAKKS